MLRRFAPRILLAAVLLAGASSVYSTDPTPLPPSNPNASKERPQQTPPFPGLYFAGALADEGQASRGRPYTAPTEAEAAAAARRIGDFKSPLMNDDLIAFYGSPTSTGMGILGLHPVAELDALLQAQAAEYDAANGERGVKRAFYIIYGTAWPGGEIGILREARLREYIDYAAAHDMLVFLDHQIGKYSVADAMKRILPFLRYPNVHLALDPEWRTLKPMEEIGSVTAEEINQAQVMMEDYLVEHDYPGERMLVIHQFNYKMIGSREQVRSDFSRVRLIHCADGFGPPAVKRSSYAYNALAKNIPLKAFKLFYKTDIRGAGYDIPLMKAQDVLNLSPRPSFIMYQ